MSAINKIKNYQNNLIKGKLRIKNLFFKSKIKKTKFK